MIIFLVLQTAVLIALAIDVISKKKYGFCERIPPNKLFKPEQYCNEKTVPFIFSTYIIYKLMCIMSFYAFHAKEKLNAIIRHWVSFVQLISASEWLKIKRGIYLVDVRRFERVVKLWKQKLKFWVNKKWRKIVENCKMNLFMATSVAIKVCFLAATFCQFLEFLFYAVLVSLSAERNQCEHFWLKFKKFFWNLGIFYYFLRFFE